MLQKLRSRTRRGSSQEGQRYLFIGLGNPGSRYQRTRHNAGFMVIDELARRLPSGTERSRFNAALLETMDADERLVLAKPQTFMNASGSAVQQIARWYNVPPEQLLVIYDDMDLPFGTLRLRAEGSAGGHNGVSSIIASLGHNRFARLRVGIGRIDGRNSANHVLSQFSRDEEAQLPQVIDKAANAALAWLRDGLTPTMNEYNRKSEPRAHKPAPDAQRDPNL